MFRIRMTWTLVALLAAIALLAAACSDDGGETVTPEPQDVAEATSTTQAGPDEVSDGGDPAEEDITGPSDSDDDTADDSGSGDGTSTSEDGEPAVPVDAEALLASATTTLDGRSARGEATFDLAPGFGLSTSFESDADGDLAAIVELPPGVDPAFPGGADAEVRYVGGLTYVRPPVSAETLSELGVDEAWYVAEPVAGGDPMSDVMQSAGGVMCVFPQSLDAPADNCDLLGETGTFLEAAGEAEIIGREDVRGTEATRVRFQVSLMDLMGDALGQAFGEDDGETSDGAFLDDGSSDPFAEGMEAFFAMLDTGFEVDVWIDDDTLIRRLAFDLASMFAGLAGADEAIPSSLITLEFYDFDADISVDAPPPELIVDDPSLLGRGGSGGGAGGEVIDPFEDDYGDDYDDGY